jgi:SAM-dependent methyltransferase
MTDVLRTVDTISDEEDRIRNAYARRGHAARDSFLNPGHLFMIQERERRVLPLLARYGFAQLGDARILEVGCGTGQWLRDLVRWGANPVRISGIDLLPDRIAAAEAACAAGIRLACGSATSLPFADADFDIVLQSTVFTSILDRGVRGAVAAEIRRVLRPRGVILWYDYHLDNPANPDVRGVSRRDIDDLFPGCEIDLQRVTLAPPLARAIAPYSRIACEWLQLIPLLRTHYLGIIRIP